MHDAGAGNRTLRILHVVGGMPRAGTETWLMQLLRRVDRTALAMDFLVHTTVPQAYDEEVRSLGANLIPCLGRYGGYAPKFLKVLEEHGPYDIVHSHVQHFGGLVLALAHVAGIPVRIAHSHNDTLASTQSAGWRRRMYVRSMNALVRQSATHGIAVSKRAAVALFGATWMHDPRWLVMSCGVDLSAFEKTYDRDAARNECRIPPGALVVGHVGRFAEQKNHGFLMNAFAAVLKQDPTAVLVLAGEGPLRAAIERQADALGLRDRVRFLGSRGDVPRLMSVVFDVFLFPSLCEGLGLVLVEAQAAGLRCVISDVIPQEADVVPGLVSRVSLDSSAETWALEVCAAAGKGRSPDRPATAHWPFAIEASAAGLIDLYREAVAGDRQCKGASAAA